MVVESLESKVAVQYVLQFSRGGAMDWKTILAYITGSVDQELLSRYELGLITINLDELVGTRRQ